MMDDKPYHRVTVSEMTQPQLESWLTGVRARRMKVKVELEEALKVRQLMKEEKDKEALEKHLKMLDKEAATYDRAALKIEARLTKILELKLIAERS